MTHLKHRRASGVFSNFWEYDSGRRVVIASVRFGNTDFDFEVSVCTAIRPRPGAFLIVQRSSEVWELTPGCYEQDGLFLVAKTTRVIPSLTAMPFMLTNAYEDLSLELLAL